VAVGWRTASVAGRAIWSVLLACSLSIAGVVFSVGRGVLAWNTRDGWARWLAWLDAPANLSRAWPSFFWDLTPGVASSEVPFAEHALVWLAVPLAAGWLTRRLARGRPYPVAVTAAGFWLVGVVTLQAGLGWWMTGGDPLSPAGRQVAVLSEAAAGRPVRVLGPWSERRGDAVATGLAVRVPRRDLFDSDAAIWAPLASVPGGRYALDVHALRPRGGRLTVRLATGPPLAVWTLEPSSTQTLSLALPAGADRLQFEPDETLAASVSSLVLRPTVLNGVTRDLAVARVAIGTCDVFLRDGNAFVESDGFWVRGSSTAALAISGPVDRPDLTMELANGGVPNRVVVAEATGEQVLDLEPWARQPIVVPLDRAGAASLRITSTAGFRPADLDPASADRRWLGVRVSRREAAR
jgi:hypothetical protein